MRYPEDIEIKRDRLNSGHFRDKEIDCVVVIYRFEIASGCFAAHAIREYIHVPVLSGRYGI